MNKVDTQRLEEENNRLKSDIIALNAVINKKDRLQRDYDVSQISYEKIFEQSALGNKFINANLEIIKVNKALVKLLGYSKKELLGSRITDLAHPDFVEHWEKLQHTLWIANKRSFSIDTCLIKKDKTTIWCHVTSIPFKDNGETLGYTIIEDISTRKASEDKLKQANNYELLFRQGLLEATIHAHEKERLYFSEEVHNNLAQLLYGIKLSLDQVDLQGPDRKAQSETAFKKAKEVLSKCIEESRRISYELMPPALETFGLKPAIEDMCEQVKGSIDLKYHINGLHGRLPRHLEIATYRIVQELTANVLKHAVASKASINLSFKKEAITIWVEDNGIGFDMLKVKDGSTRIRSIDNKLHLLNGRSDILARPGGGTIISVHFPR
jgi:PAS domain S-box-containing protein